MSISQIPWTILLNLDGPALEEALLRYIPEGYKPQQVGAGIAYQPPAGNLRSS